MSGSSNLDSFRDDWLVAIQLQLCRVLSPGLVQYCSQHSCVIAVSFFSSRFVSVKKKKKKKTIATFNTYPCSIQVRVKNVGAISDAPRICIYIYIYIYMYESKYESKYGLKSDSMKVAEKHNPNR